MEMGFGPGWGVRNDDPGAAVLLAPGNKWTLIPIGGVTGMRPGMELEFQCVEDLLGLPTCTSIPTVFGDVNIVQDSGKRYVSANPRNNVASNADEPNCAKVSFISWLL